MARKGFSKTDLITRNKEIASVLHEYRQRRRFTLNQCATKIGVTDRHYAALELGDVKIYAAYVDVLAEFLDIPPNDLWLDRGPGNRAFVMVDKVEGGKLHMGVYMTVVLPEPSKLEPSEPEPAEDIE